MTTDQLRSTLESAHRSALEETEGAVATYIPELARVDPDMCGISICTVDGDTIDAGDSDHRFSIQSACKPFLFAAALERFGPEGVFARVGVEPTGDAFDSIVRLESGTNRPHNPMINAGAIAISALLAGSDPSGRVDTLLDIFRNCCGSRDVHLDVPVYLSEKSAGYRNRAIAHLMRHLRMLETDVEEALDFYFQACSVAVSASDLATMGATLASGGINPVTGERVVAADHVRDVLTVMTTCGMYDAAGRFLFEVGVPAKSGVSGAMLAVVPGRLAIGAWSPRLDANGHSVRGMHVVRRLSRDLDLHMFHGEAPATRFRTTERDRADELQQALDDLTAGPPGTGDGAVADYIPELAEADPDRFGLAICTVDGELFGSGDAESEFTIQAAVNPFTYAFALEEHGIAAVHERVGMEPSGNPYNAIVFNPETNRPYNPLGNAGAITVASLLPGSDAADRARQLSEFIGGLAEGKPLDFNARVLASEKRAGERNRAIAYLLRNFDVIDDVESALELYTQQCSLEVNCRILATMGATLAAAGTNPITGKRALRGETTRALLSTMYSCGMHDGSGTFAFEVGSPGKSGISGGIVMAVPGRMGVAVLSPPVDSRGASVRGAAALERLSRRLKLGAFSS